MTDSEPVGGASLTPATYFTPGLIAFAIHASCLLAAVVELIVLRETGVLKTPTRAPHPRMDTVGGRALAATANSLAVAALLLIVATNGYDASVPPPAE